jgi:hypothetical protein
MTKKTSGEEADITRYQGVTRKGDWSTTRARNVDKHGGFEPGRAFEAFTEPPAARNTVRLRRRIDYKGSVCF